MLCLAIQVLPASADAYLDALNDAADDIELDPNSKRPQQQSTNSAARVSVDGAMPAGMSQSDFETFLQRRFLGSYAFYQKLNSGAKTRVFEAYKGRAEIDYVRDQIKRQYLGR